MTAAIVATVDNPATANRPVPVTYTPGRRLRPDRQVKSVIKTATLTTTAWWRRVATIGVVAVTLAALLLAAGRDEPADFASTVALLAMAAALGLRAAHWATATQSADVPHRGEVRLAVEPNPAPAVLAAPPGVRSLELVPAPAAEALAAAEIAVAYAAALATAREVSGVTEPRGPERTPLEQPRATDEDTSLPQTLAVSDTRPRRLRVASLGVATAVAVGWVVVRRLRASRAGAGGASI